MDSHRLSSYWEGLLTLSEVQEWLYELFAQARIPLERRKTLFQSVLVFLNQFDESHSWFDVLRQALLEALLNPSITPGFNPYFAGLLRVIRQAHSKAVIIKTRTPLSDEELLLFNTLLRFVTLPPDFSEMMILRVKNAPTPSELLDVLLDTFFLSLGQQAKRSKERLVELLHSYILRPLVAIDLEFTSSKQTLHIIRRFDAYFVPRIYVVPHYRTLGLFHGLLQLRRISLEAALETRVVEESIPSMTFLGVAFQDPISDCVYVEVLLRNPLEAFEFGANFSEYESYSYYLSPKILHKIPSEMISRHYYFRAGAELLDVISERFLEENHVIMHGGRVETIWGSIQRRTAKATEKLTQMIDNEVIYEYPWVSPPTIIGSYNRPILVRTDPIPSSEIQKFEALLECFPIVDITRTRDLWLIRLWTDPRDVDRFSKVSTFLRDLRCIGNNVSSITTFQNIRGKRMPSACDVGTFPKGIKNTWWSGRIGIPINSRIVMETAKRLGYSARGNSHVIELFSPNLFIRFKASKGKLISFEILKSETALPDQVQRVLDSLLQSRDYTFQLDRLVVSINKKARSPRKSSEKFAQIRYLLPSKPRYLGDFCRKSDNIDELWLLRTESIPLSVSSVNFLIEQVLGGDWVSFI